jgi:hypothetical protein
MSQTMICFRVPAPLKRRVEDAARRKGQGITTFLLEVVEKAVRKVETMPTKVAKKVRGRHTGCSGYFRACCWEAARGGRLGYARAGYELARHLPYEMPWDIDLQEWQGELDRFSELAMPTEPISPESKLRRIAEELRDDDEVLAWFEAHFPRFMELVPKRRRQQFLSGVYQCCEDGKVGLEV